MFLISTAVVTERAGDEFQGPDLDGGGAGVGVGAGEGEFPEPILVRSVGGGTGELEQRLAMVMSKPAVSMFAPPFLTLAGVRPCRKVPAGGGLEGAAVEVEGAERVRCRRPAVIWFDVQRAAVEVVFAAAWVRCW